MNCKICGSNAINPHLYGRNNTDLDLCDVCYWKKRADLKASALELALLILWELEPGDSRAVSDEFVAMSVISCDVCDADNCLKIIHESIVQRTLKQ